MHLRLATAKEKIDASVHMALDLVEGDLWSDGGKVTMMLESAFVRLGVMALVLVLGLAVGYRTGLGQGRAEVQAQWDTQRIEHAKTVLRAIEARDALQTRLTQTIERQRQEHRHAVQSLVAERNALLERLRERPSRDTGGANLPSDSGAGSGVAGCTGQQLYREDAAFLIGEAHRADRLQLALNQCKAAYDEVRQQINGANK